MEKKRWSLILMALCLALAFSVIPVEAGSEKSPKKCNDEIDNDGDGLIDVLDPDCGGGGGNGVGETECRIEFCINFANADGDAVSSDDGSNYCHGSDKVIAFTGNGPGFRFDTNGKSQKLEGAGAVRDVLIDLSNFDPTVFNPPGFTDSTALKGVDLRFELPDGLDLCSLENVPESGTVGLLIAFEVVGANDNRHTLIYGTPVSTSATAPPGADCGLPVTVTRTDEAMWTISGTKACLMDGGPAFGVVLDGGKNNLGEPGLGKDAIFRATLTAITAIP